MDLLYRDEEEQLRRAVAHLLTSRRDLAGTLRRAETEDPYDHPLWRALGSELGVTGLLVPEELGGQGATAREAAVVCEELGREVVAVPFLGSAVLATVALRACSSRAADDLLRALASGEATVAVALPWTTSPQRALGPSVTSSDGALTGSVSGVLDGGPADVLVVPARRTDDRADDIALFAVPTDGEGVDHSVVRGIDVTRGWIDVHLDGAAGEVLATGAEAAAAPGTGLLHAAAMVASEQVGVAEACLAATVEYVSERHQFGRPVGSFQALKHRLADVWLGVVGARAAARHAADALARHADDRTAAVAVAVAKAHCSEVAVLAAEESLQMHGGIGMTWEHPTHIYLQRAKLDELLFGSPGRHRSDLADLVDLPEA